MIGHNNFDFALSPTLRTYSAPITFAAPAVGPSDAVMFGEWAKSAKPLTNCNSRHKVKAYRTISAGKTHALTDQIIVDFNGRDTNDCEWVGISWSNKDGYDCSYNTKYAAAHKRGIKIEHDGEEVYSFEMAGTTDNNGWGSSQPYLITKAGKWEVFTNHIDSGSCGNVGPEDGSAGDWISVGSFTAEEPLDDCYYKGREEGANIGDCGDCLTGYTEVGGECQADSSGSSDGAGSGGGSVGTMDNSQIYMIGGGVLLLALLLKRKK